MNREFVFSLQDGRPSAWARVGATLNRWMWIALCCGVPGVPCFFCRCCEKHDDIYDRDMTGTCADQATATADRMVRPHRPHAPGVRKSRPEMVSALGSALSQLQGEPAPPSTPPFPDDPLQAVIANSTEPG